MGTTTRFASRVPRPSPASEVPVVTPRFGAGTVLVSDRAIQAVWDGVDVAGARKGAVLVEARLVVDEDAAWGVQAALVAPTGGAHLDESQLRSARDEVDAAIVPEVLAAASEAVLSVPEEVVVALRNGASGVDDETLAAAVTRVLERLETDRRLQDVERALSEGRDPGEPAPREAVAEAVRDLRPEAGYGF